MDKEQLGTRITVALGQRLRVYAAMNRQTYGEVVSVALDNYLPPLSAMVTDTHGDGRREDHGGRDAEAPAGRAS